jgi:hypothetical protein
MKKILNFAVMALVAAMSFVACTEKTNEPLSIEGKAWSFEWAIMDNAPCVFDFGVNEPGTAHLLVDMFVFLEDAVLGESYYPYFSGNYTITEKTATSGSISIVDPADPSAAAVVFEYSDLTENTVKLSCDEYGFDNTVLTLISKKPVIADME